MCQGLHKGKTSKTKQLLPAILHVSSATVTAIQDEGPTVQIKLSKSIVGFTESIKMRNKLQKTMPVKHDPCQSQTSTVVSHDPSESSSSLLEILSVDTSLTRSILSSSTWCPAGI